MSMLMTKSMLAGLWLSKWGLPQKLTEEQQESNAIQNQNVRNVIDASSVHQLHLFLGSSHEEESTGTEKLYFESVDVQMCTGIDSTYEWWQILEAIWVCSIFRHILLIFHNEADLNTPRHSSSHESVSENAVRHSRDLKSLRVRAHGVTSQEDN